MYQHNDHTKFYAVSFISFHDNELKTDFVYADSAEHAMKEMLVDQGWSELDDLETSAEIKQFAFDGDCMVDAVVVP